MDGFYDLYAILLIFIAAFGFARRYILFKSEPSHTYQIHQINKQEPIYQNKQSKNDCFKCYEKKKKFICSNTECEKIIYHCIECDGKPKFCIFCSNELLPSCKKCEKIKNKIKCNKVDCDYTHFYCTFCDVSPNFCIKCGDQLNHPHNKRPVDENCSHKQRKNTGNLNYCLKCGVLMDNEKSDNEKSDNEKSDNE